MNILLKKFLQHSQQEYTSMKLGLERVQEVLAQLDHPEKSYPSVLIAGTNGKGSVARMLESVLLQAKHRVGLYTSPHLKSFTERIRIGDHDVSEEELEEVLKDFREKGILNEQGEMKTPTHEKLTWFEKVTVLAFEIFRRKKIDLAILEVGLGARLDATNVVEPLVSAITSISLDHTQVLGNSLFEIAREKAGVMRAGKPVVIGKISKEVREFLVQAAYLQKSQPILAQTPQGSNRDFSYDSFKNLQLKLEGNHQLNNAAVVIEILKILNHSGFSWKESELREGLSHANNPGRLEWIEGKPAILLDGAHNVESMEALVKYLKEHLSQKKLTIVLGMMVDKEVLPALKLLKEFNLKWIFTEINHPRSRTVAQWQEISNAWKLQAEVYADSSMALKIAKEQAPWDGVILVTGSLYLVGELRREVLVRDV